MALTIERTEFDFIVIGGGTAGCVVAGRLAENPNVKILVIEAGISFPGDVDAITTPARAFELRGSKHDWANKTTMIDRPEYTRIEKPNTRGKRRDLRRLGRVRRSRMTWEKCRNYLSKSASYHDDLGLHRPELSYIGQGGRIPVSHSDLVPELEGFRTALTQAWTRKGHALTDDVHNGTMQGLWKATNSIHAGRRCSSWLYLVDKPNVTVLAQTHSKRLLLGANNSKAVGVEVIGPDNQIHTFHAKHEVILSSGVFESPKLLLLSGIGPAASLAPFTITQLIESPHVGQNLLDHPILAHVFRLRDGYGLDKHLLRAGLERDAAVSAYRWKNKGPLTSGLLELVGLPRIDERLAKIPAYVAAKEANGGLDPFGPGGQPHFEIDFVPMFADAFQWHIPTPPQGEYLTVIVDLLRPLSRSGTVELGFGGCVLVQPKVNINFFEIELDIVALREGIRWVDDILMTGEGMKEIVGEDYPWPMPRHSDEAMNKMILERSQTGFHPCGTARMGKDIDQGVVDSQLRVHGVRNLRVIDASVIPVIPNCRIQMSVYMIGERGADFIKAAHPELYA